MPDVTGPSPRQGASWTDLPAHPRLFVNDTRLAALRGRTDKVSIQLKDLLIGLANRHLAAPEVAYVDTGSFLMEAMREVQGRILSLSLAWRLSGEDRYFLRARDELLRLAGLPDWGRSHFLDVGEAAHAAGTGLDWLFDRLDSGERDQVYGAIVNKALLPSLNAEEGLGGWVDGDYNWNQVCHAGLVVGALAVAELEPVLARTIVARAVRNVPKAMAAYAPDGSHPEGPSYWSYGTTFNVIMMEAMRSVLGDSRGLDLLPGFSRTADFRMQVIAPGGEAWNYSDYHRENQNEPVMLWFARELRRAGIARGELANLGELQAALSAPAGEPSGGRIRASRHLPLELSWWDPSLAAADDAPALRWIATGGLPMAVMRSAWNDPRAVFVAVKGGTPNQSHGHMDVGSFILEARGVRWAVDLGTESYGRMRSAGIDLWSYSQDSTRWTTFRVGPEGHNILRFDGGRQEVAGRAAIRAAGTGAVVDLMPLYRSRCSMVQRSLDLGPDGTAVIVDEWRGAGAPVEVAWQWLTLAEVERTKGGLLLRQSGEALELRVEASAGTSTDVEDVSLPRLPQDSPNSGLRRIVVRLRTPAAGAGRLAVTAVPRNA